MPESTDFAALSLLPIAWRLEIAERLRAGANPRELIEVLIGERPDVPTLTSASIRARGAAAIERARRDGITCVCWSDAAYPPMLGAIVDPPPLLWVRGDIRSFDLPAVAIVGSRAGSPYALAIAERLAGDLAAAGVVVISGLARGVDSAAHRGALAGGGMTIAVLGCGADIVYPSENGPLAREITASGALVSELEPGTSPLPLFFPMRNRIISGLSRAVVVIEAGERSGSLITARSALEQGRDVLAVPGNVLSGRNRGGHGLLRDGAKIVETADDILGELGLVDRSRKESHSGAAPPSDPILACLTPGEPSDVDAIAERSGLAITKLLPRLCDLELQGLIRRAGAGRFIRFDSSC
jgi:DNA processing protein